LSNHCSIVKMKQTGTIFKIKKFALHDGPGIRTTVFFKGCPLSCWWCHNPEGIGFNREVVIYTKKKDEGHSSEITEHLGKKVDVHHIITEVEKDVIFYDESGGGVTFSGGEPLAQPEFLQELLRECRNRELHTALDTTGYTGNGSMEYVVDLVDLVLFDLKLYRDEDHIKYTGVSNKTILSNLRLASDSVRDLIIRIPIVPGITDSQDNLDGLQKIISGLNSVLRVDLLPFHRIGFAKRERMGMRNQLDKCQSPDDSHMEIIKKQFENEGLKVRIGG